jgi:hypothetical protein
MVGYIFPYVIFRGCPVTRWPLLRYKSNGCSCCTMGLVCTECNDGGRWRSILKCVGCVYNSLPGWSPISIVIRCGVQFCCILRGFCCTPRNVKIAVCVVAHVLYTSHTLQNRTSTATNIALGAHEPHSTATTAIRLIPQNWPPGYRATTKNNIWEYITYHMITLGQCNFITINNVLYKVLLIRDLVDGFR